MFITLNFTFDLSPGADQFIRLFDQYKFMHDVSFNCLIIKQIKRLKVSESVGKCRIENKKSPISKALRLLESVGKFIYLSTVLVFGQ